MRMIQILFQGASPRPTLRGLMPLAVTQGNGVPFSQGKRGLPGCMGSSGWIDWYTEYAWRRDTSRWRYSIQHRLGHRIPSLLLRGNGLTARRASPARTSGAKPKRGRTPTCATRSRSGFAAPRNEDLRLIHCGYVSGFHRVIGTLVPRRGTRPSPRPVLLHASRSRSRLRRPRLREIVPDGGLHDRLERLFIELLVLRDIDRPRLAQELRVEELLRVRKA